MPEAFVITFVAIALLVWLILRRSGDAPVDSFYDPSDGDRQPHKWGYTDTIFEFDGPRSVRVTGSRYPLAGYSMPYFVPFAEEVLGVPITPEEMMPEVPRQEPPPPAVMVWSVPRPSPAMTASRMPVVVAMPIVRAPVPRLPAVTVKPVRN